MRTKDSGTVLSREVDEHGTRTIIEGGRAALTIRNTPHETLHQMFTRITEHVAHVAPLDGPVPASVWKTEETTVFGLDFTIAYGAGAGLVITAHRKDEKTPLCSGNLPASNATLAAAGELYGEVLNRAVDIVQAQRAA